MFKDYYQILEIPFGSDLKSIKNAYREQSLKWHPDRHPEMDVTCRMQDINEAYAILKDTEAKTRYNIEYLSCQMFHGKTYSQDTSSNMSDNTDRNHSTGYRDQNHHQYYYDYTVNDDTLNENILKARAYAKELVEEFFAGFKRNSKLAIKGAWDEVSNWLIGIVVLLIISIIIRLCAH